MIARPRGSLSDSVLHSLCGKVLQVLQARRVSRKEVSMVGLTFMKCKESHLAWVPARSAPTLHTAGHAAQSWKTPGDTMADHFDLSRRHSAPPPVDSEALGG